MTISEVSEKYGLTAVTLRYYEKIGLIPPVTRNKSGVRDYQPEECGWVEFVKCMRSAGMPVETLLQSMALLREGEHTKPERMQLLVRQREALFWRSAGKWTKRSGGWRARLPIMRTTGRRQELHNSPGPKEPARGAGVRTITALIQSDKKI